MLHKLNLIVWLDGTAAGAAKSLGVRPKQISRWRAGKYPSPFYRDKIDARYRIAVEARRIAVERAYAEANKLTDAQAIE